MSDLDFRVKNGLIVNDNFRTSGSGNVELTSTLSTVDVSDATVTRSAKYLMQISDGIDYQVSEILLIHDSNSSNITEYGVLYTGAGPLAMFITDLNNNDLRLRGMSLTGNAKIWFQKTAIDSAGQD